MDKSYAVPEDPFDESQDTQPYDYIPPSERQSMLPNVSDVQAVPPKVMDRPINSQDEQTSQKSDDLLLSLGLDWDNDNDVTNESSIYISGYDDVTKIHIPTENERVKYSKYIAKIKAEYECEGNMLVMIDPNQKLFPPSKRSTKKTLTPCTLPKGVVSNSHDEPYYEVSRMTLSIIMDLAAEEPIIIKGETKEYAFNPYIDQDFDMLHKVLKLGYHGVVYINPEDPKYVPWSETTILPPDDVIDVETYNFAAAEAWQNLINKEEDITKQRWGKGFVTDSIWVNDSGRPKPAIEIDQSGNVVNELTDDLAENSNDEIHLVIKQLCLEIEKKHSNIIEIQDTSNVRNNIDQSARKYPTSMEKYYTPHDKTRYNVSPYLNEKNGKQQVGKKKEWTTAAIPDPSLLGPIRTPQKRYSSYAQDNHTPPNKRYMRDTTVSLSKQPGSTEYVPTRNNNQQSSRSQHLIIKGKKVVDQGQLQFVNKQQVGKKKEWTTAAIPDPSLLGPIHTPQKRYMRDTTASGSRQPVPTDYALHTPISDMNHQSSYSMKLSTTIIDVDQDQLDFVRKPQVGKKKEWTTAAIPDPSLLGPIRTPQKRYPSYAQDNHTPPNKRYMRDTTASGSKQPGSTEYVVHTPISDMNHQSSNSMKLNTTIIDVDQDQLDFVRKPQVGKKKAWTTAAIPDPSLLDRIRTPQKRYSSYTQDSHNVPSKRYMRDPIASRSSQIPSTGYQNRYPSNSFENIKPYIKDIANVFSMNSTTSTTTYQQRPTESQVPKHRYYSNAKVTNVNIRDVDENSDID